MDNTTVLVMIVGLWVLTGLLLGYSMRRRGHDFWVWFALGATMGPLAIPLAVTRAHQHPVEYAGEARAILPGRFDILAGIDGSDESQASVIEALKLFGGCVTSLTLAMVLDYEAGGAYTGEPERSAALGRLEKAADSIGFRPVETRLLFGKPAEALIEFAHEEDVELIVVGARGHGVSEALFGSVTARLVGGYDVPVFVGPRDPVVAPTRIGRSEGG